MCVFRQVFAKNAFNKQKRIYNLRLKRLRIILLSTASPLLQHRIRFSRFPLYFSVSNRVCGSEVLGWNTCGLTNVAAKWSGNFTYAQGCIEQTQIRYVLQCWERLRSHTSCRTIHHSLADITACTLPERLTVCKTSKSPISEPFICEALPRKNSHTNKIVEGS